jgi:hypothetical protein
MCCIAVVGFGLTVNYPGCERAPATVTNVVCDLSFVYLVYLTVITILNYLAERRLEKRTTKEFIWLLAIQLVLISSFTALMASAFYSQCCEPNQ